MPQEEDGHFCPDCRKILIIETNSNEVTKYCSGCEKTFPGSSEDTLISSSLSSVKGHHNNIILKNAPFDRVNEIVKQKCPRCSRRYMYKVFLNEQVWYVCDNCTIKLSGKDI